MTHMISTAYAPGRLASYVWQRHGQARAGIADLEWPSDAAISSSRASGLPPDMVAVSLCHQAFPYPALVMCRRRPASRVDERFEADCKIASII